MINSKTKLMGIFGYPLQHSLSPIMHNKTLQKMGLNYCYVPLEVKPDDIGKAVEAIRFFDILGVNVTIPYKEKVIKYLDGLSPEAKACEAVNLIKNEGGRLVGYNTDGLGFVSGLEEAGVAIKGNVLIIGAGGAARAVGYSLAKKVQEILFLDIDKSKAQELALFIMNQTGTKSHGLEMNQDILNELKSWADIIINSTPVGMFPKVEDTPIDNLDGVKEHVVLCDLIYNPLQTKLLAMGQEKGLYTINGLPMFIHQGALTLKILTGEDPPIAFMKEVILNQMQQ
ncbi:MAG: shikimate dehydrogenase [Syntrophomonadaceae bacterium]|nr:shikimate dehydrogenase [Syntrophomonadaceae bacterium]